MLDELGITHEHTPPDKPSPSTVEYNGVPERVLDFIREKVTVEAIEEHRSHAMHVKNGQAISCRLRH